MSDAERRGHLFLVIDHVLDVQREWAESDTPYLSEAVDEAVTELVEVFATGSIPGGCRELNARVEELGVEFSNWHNDAELNPEQHQTPGNGFWKAMNAVEDGRRAAEPREPVTLESIEELIRQKVTERQICRIYGFENPDGSPQLRKVREELARPGTHVNADFVPPLERARQTEELKAQQTVQRIRARQAEKLAQVDAPAQESVEKLVAEGISARQIGRMHHVTPESVIELCKSKGIKPPPLDYASVASERGALEKPLSDEEARAFDAEESNPTRNRKGIEPMEPLEPMQPVESMQSPEPIELADYGEADDATATTLEQQIVEQFEEGLRPGEIAKAMENVSLQKVNSVIKRYREEPEVFLRVPGPG